MVDRPTVNRQRDLRAMVAQFDDEQLTDLVMNNAAFAKSVVHAVMPDDTQLKTLIKAVSQGALNAIYDNLSAEKFTCEAQAVMTFTTAYLAVGMILQGQFTGKMAKELGDAKDFNVQSYADDSVYMLKLLLKEALRHFAGVANSISKRDLYAEPTAFADNFTLEPIIPHGEKEQTD